MIKTTNSTWCWARVGVFVCVCDIGSSCFLNDGVPKGGVLFGEEGPSHCSPPLSVLGTCICLLLVWGHTSWLTELSPCSLGVPARGWGRSLHSLISLSSPSRAVPGDSLSWLSVGCQWYHLAWGLLFVDSGLWLSPPGWLVSCSFFKAVVPWSDTFIILFEPSWDSPATL